MFLIISLALLPVLLAQKEFSVDVDCTKEPARSSHEDCKSNRRRQSGKILFHETDHAVDAGERIAAEIRKQLVKEFGLRADVDCTKEPARSSHEDFKSIRERRSGKILFHENCAYFLVSANSCNSVFDCADDQACVGANANTPGTCQ